MGVPHWEYNNNTQWDYKIYKDKKNSWYLAFESVYSETKIVNKMYVYKWCCSITESLWISYISFMRRWKEMKKHQRAMKAKQAEVVTNKQNKNNCPKRMRNENKLQALRKVEVQKHNKIYRCLTFAFFTIFLSTPNSTEQARQPLHRRGYLLILEKRKKMV